MKALAPTPWWILSLLLLLGAVRVGAGEVPTVPRGPLDDRPGMWRIRSFLVQPLWERHQGDPGGSGSRGWEERFLALGPPGEAAPEEGTRLVLCEWRERVLQVLGECVVRSSWNAGTRRVLEVGILRFVYLDPMGAVRPAPGSSGLLARNVWVGGLVDGQSPRTGSWYVTRKRPAREVRVPVRTRAMVLAGLLRDLRSPDEGIRGFAAQRLGVEALDPARVVPALGRILRDRVQGVRLMGILALRTYAPESPAARALLEKAMGDRDAGLRSIAAMLCAALDIAERRAAPLLAEAVLSDQAQARRAGFEGLRLLSPSAARLAVPRLRKAPKSPAVALALALIGEDPEGNFQELAKAIRIRVVGYEAYLRFMHSLGSRAVPLLLELLGAEAATTRVEAAIQLARLGAGKESARTVLVRDGRDTLTSKDYPRLNDALARLGSSLREAEEEYVRDHFLRDPALRKRFLDYMVSHDEGYLARVVERWGDAAVPELVGALQGVTFFNIARPYFLALSRLGPSGNRAILDLAARGSPELRPLALEAAGTFLPEAPETAHLLLAALNSSDWRLRRVAGDGLGKLDAVTATLMPELVSRLRTAVAARDREALDALGEALEGLGAAAAPALPVLEQVLRIEDNSLRAGVVDARTAIVRAQRRDLGAREVVPLWIQELSHPYQAVRIEAARALARRYTRAGPGEAEVVRSAMPALKALKRDRVKVVRKAANESLRVLRRR